MLLFLRYGTALALLAVSLADCPGSPWKEWNGHCYRLSDSPATWLQIQRVCTSTFKQAHVASIASKAENDFIAKSVVGDESAWLGMESHHGNRSWTDESPVNFTHFESSGASGGETANSVVKLEGSTGLWQLVPRYDGSKLHGVCKMASCDCAPDWTKWHNRCYKMGKCPRGWLEARKQCRHMAPLTDLATISCPSENDFVSKMMSGKEPFWIGLSDREQEGKFEWSRPADNTSAAYTNWAKDEPNGAHHSEDCVQVDKSGKWSDVKCADHLLSYVCQQPMCGSRTETSQKAKSPLALLFHRKSCARCPTGWTCSRRKCFSKPTTADTFEGVREMCKKLHPRARVATISSLADNDNAFLATSGNQTTWIAPCGSFKNWQNAPPDRKGCSSLQSTGQWRSEPCDKKHPGICQIPACVPRCPSSWHAFKGNCYFVNGTTHSLPSASASCRSAGGHLASILSQEENDFITTLAFPRSHAHKLKEEHQQYAFIGASRANDRSRWSWEDCAALAISRLSSADYDDTSLAQGTCAALNAEGRWRGFDNCDQLSMRSVCKLDPCRSHFGALDRPDCSRTGKSMCPQDGKAWRYENGVCLLSFISRPSSFPRAFRTCRSAASSEFDVSVSVVRFADTKSALMRLAKGRHMWVGLTRRHTGQWYWHDLTKARHVPWQVKPNAATRCASIDGKTGGLRARRCSQSLPFLCEARFKTE